MKKIIAILLVLVTLAGLTACKMFRKVDDDPNAYQPTEEPVESESYATDFSDTVPEDEPKTPVRYSEEQAYDLLTHSFPDYDMELIKIERTKEIVAEDDGTEYYIFNVSLPKIVETEPPADTEEGGDTTEATETKAVEMEPAVPYYVSVNGVVHKELASQNVDTKYVRDAFAKKFGDSDKTTGYAYKLVYEGVIPGDGKLCYNYKVFTVDTSGSEPKDVYAFNFLVTLDGKLSANPKLEN